jgi:hypothetical protein
VIQLIIEVGICVPKNNVVNVVNKTISKYIMDVSRYIHDVVQNEYSLNKILLQKRTSYIVYFGLLMFSYLCVMLTKNLQKPQYYCMIAIFTIFPIYVEYYSYYMLYLTKVILENISTEMPMNLTLYIVLLIPIILLLLAPISVHIPWLFVKMRKDALTLNKHYTEKNENEKVISNLKKNVEYYQQNEKFLTDVLPEAKVLIKNLKINNLKNK